MQMNLKTTSEDFKTFTILYDINQLLDLKKI